MQSTFKSHCSLSTVLVFSEKLNNYSITAVIKSKILFQARIIWFLICNGSSLVEIVNWQAQTKAIISLEQLLLAI